MPAIAPIVTLSLNPSVDVTYDVDQLVEDRKVHANAYRYDPGGNGINVARALKRLGVDAHACFVAAGEIGALLERLLQQQLAHAHCAHVRGETRVNVTVAQRRPRAQYEVIGVGPTADGDALADLLRRMVALSRGGFGVLTGSLPPGVPDDTYARLHADLARHGARVVVDMQGEQLAAAVARRPFLVKPNRFELEQLVGRPLPTVPDVAREALALHCAGVAHVFVSLGGEGAVLADARGVRLGRAPAVKVASTVGAGDSMVAGLLAAFARGEDADAALRLGLACGSGTATQPGTELFRPEQIAPLAERVDISVLMAD